MLHFAPHRMRNGRQTIGVFLLAASVVYSALSLTVWFHPMALRMRAHGGIERLMAIALSSLFLKALLLGVGAILAFWPRRT